jgi:hypothetical protein
MHLRIIVFILVLSNLLGVSMAGQKVECGCCGRLVDERTERRHRGLQAPVATLASSPYVAAYRERRHLEPRLAHVKSQSKQPLVLAPPPESSDEEDDAPPIHPLDVDTAIDEIIRAARVGRQIQESDDDSLDVDSDGSQIDEAEASDEEMDNLDDAIDVWDIIDEMIIQEAARAFTPV